MKNEVLIEFYDENFSHIIPRKPDGRVRDYLTDMLPYYLRGIAIQEMGIAGIKLESGVAGRYSKETEMIIADIVAHLREEMQMDTHDRAVSRISRNYTYTNQELDPNVTGRELIERELQKPDFQRLCFDLDYHKKQLQNYIDLCEKYGVSTTISFEEDDNNIVITRRV